MEKETHLLPNSYNTITYYRYQKCPSARNNNNIDNAPAEVYLQSLESTPQLGILLEFTNLCSSSAAGRPA